MGIALIILLFAAGILLVVKGGDYFVDAASWIAEVSGIPKLIIGATIVSVATTLPEMLVSVMAAAEGKVDMSIGNAVGSVTANTGLIMAIALICMPAVIKRKDYLLKSSLMLLASFIVVVCGFTGEIKIALSAVLLCIFIFFIYENVSIARKTLALRQGAQEIKKSPGNKQKIREIQANKDIPENNNKEDQDNGESSDRAVITDRRTIILNVVKFVVGAAGIVAGARLLVDNGSELARLAGVSERIIGVTLVAVGTFLPELITTITAIAKKQSSLSVGNILGANILDLTLIMPLSSLIAGKPLPVSASFAHSDLPVCLLAGIIAVVPAMIRSKFSRLQGELLLLIYVIYVTVTCFAMR